MSPLRKDRAGFCYRISNSTGKEKKPASSSRCGLDMSTLSSVPHKTTLAKTAISCGGVHNSAAAGVTGKVGIHRDLPWGDQPKGAWNVMNRVIQVHEIYEFWLTCGSCCLEKAAAGGLDSFACWATGENKGLTFIIWARQASELTEAWENSLALNIITSKFIFPPYRLYVHACVIDSRF